MQTVDIRVAPVAGGWMVEGPPGLAPLVFHSGGRAEAAAVALARAAATAAGADARLAVLDRSGDLVGTRRFRPHDPAVPRPRVEAPRMLEAA